MSSGPRIEFLLEQMVLETRRLNEQLMTQPTRSQDFGSTKDLCSITGRKEWWVRLHAEELGGWKSAEGRGGKWTFPLTGIEERARDRTSHRSRQPPENPPTTKNRPPAVNDQTHGLTSRPRM